MLNHLLPISNPSISAERALRLAIVGDDKLKTDFVKSFLGGDCNYILPLYVTMFKSFLIEWINIPRNCPLDVIITLLQNVSGLIYASDSIKLLDQILSQKSIKVLQVSQNSSLNMSVPHIMLDDSMGNRQDKTILHQFIESLNND